MRLEDALVSFYLDHEYAPTTVTWMQTLLTRFVAVCQDRGVETIEAVTVEEVRALAAYAKTVVHPYTKRVAGDKTVYHHVNATAIFLRWCMREGLVDPAVVARIRRPKVEKKAIVPFSEQQIARLVDACKHAPYPLRDRAVVELLLDTGIRVGELRTLTLDRVHLDANGGWILVSGKGRKQRTCSVGKSAARALQSYLTRERPRNKYHTDAWVILGQRGSMSKVGVNKICKALVRTAGPSYFVGVRVSAHTFRHTHACTYMRQGGDIYTLSRNLGHTSVAVTERYLAGLPSTDLRPHTYSVLDKMQINRLQ